MKKSVLIIGAGGREHALGWKLKPSQFVEKIFFAPGNGGTRDIGENINIKPDDISSLLKFVKVKEIDLTIVGPEAPLALGITDAFQDEKLKIFGPTKKAAFLETSKAWAIEFMSENKIPHPKSTIFDNYTNALNYIIEFEGDCVIKADGLTLGKGVYVCSRLDQAREALKKIMQEKIYGSAGNRVIIQEKLVGREVSVMAFCDGKVAVPIVTAQDHKRAFDHDRGPNTGGMGAFAPATISVTSLKKMQRILTLTVERMREKGIPYIGVLYGGFMLVGNEPYVLEFNCRMGDPETQVQLPLLKSDLLTIIEACIEGSLVPEIVEFSGLSSLCVVLASDGYPGVYEKGKEISGIHNGINVNGLAIFHAGTKYSNGMMVTDGGRVLGITSISKTRNAASKKVYNAISQIHFERMQYRKDIG